MPAISRPDGTFFMCEMFASGCMELLNQTPQGARQVYNISSGKTYAISHLVEEMRARCERLFEIAVDPTRLRPSDSPLLGQFRSVGGGDPMGSRHADRNDAR